MKNRERVSLIVRCLKTVSFLSVQDIVEMTDASEATVRRDLAKLEEKCLAVRVRGGIEPAEAAESAKSEFPFEYRKSQKIREKSLIAKKAASLCAENETIIIDGGSTTFHMTEYLCNASLQIITNSFPIAETLLHNSSNQIIITGGMIIPESQLVLDPFNNELINSYYASKAFFGIGGIDDSGLTNHEPLLIQSQKIMLKRAKEIIILADSSKFGKRESLLLCGFDQVTKIITDDGIPPEFAEKIRNSGIELLIA